MSKTLVGTVSSDKANKTIIVDVHAHKTHPIYKKAYSVTKKFMAHDEKNQAQVGDKVSIVETRPLSARKRFILVKVIQKATISADKTVEAITAEPKLDAKDTKKSSSASKEQSEGTVSSVADAPLSEASVSKKSHSEEQK